METVTFLLEDSGAAHMNDLLVGVLIFRDRGIVDGIAELAFINGIHEFTRNSAYEEMMFQTNVLFLWRRCQTYL